MSAGAGPQFAVRFNARHVYRVLSPGREGNDRVAVKLNGKPLTAEVAGNDVSGSALTIDSQRLYRIVDLKEPGAGVLDLSLPKGVSGYAFTFG